MKNEIYQLREIAPQVYQIEEYGSFCYLIEGSSRALLIDTGTGFGDLAEFVRTITEKPLSVAATHAHPDHRRPRKFSRALSARQGQKNRPILRFALYAPIHVRKEIAGEIRKEAEGYTKRKISHEIFFSLRRRPFRAWR